MTAVRRVIASPAGALVYPQRGEERLGRWAPRWAVKAALLDRLWQERRFLRRAERGARSRTESGLSFVSRRLGSGDPLQKREGRCDDPEGGCEPADDDEVVVDSRWSKRVVHLCPEEQLGGEEADPDRNRRDDKKRDGAFQGDHAAEDRQRRAAQTQQAEWALAIAETAGDAHRQTAAGNQQARKDDDVC